MNITEFKQAFEIGVDFSINFLRKGHAEDDFNTIKEMGWITDADKEDFVGIYKVLLGTSINNIQKCNKCNEEYLLSTMITCDSNVICRKCWEYTSEYERSMYQ